MKSDHFYSKSTGLYVSRGPLKVDARIKKAAENLGLDLSWNDEGKVNFIDFNQSKLLLHEIGGTMMSPTEYWHIYFDALGENDEDMVNQLMSNNFCEWLDRAYTIDGYYIDHPIIEKSYKYSGKKIKQDQPNAKPGWFEPENNVNLESGHPKKVDLHRGKNSATWKYWTPDFSMTRNRPRAPIRGYVTSVGKPSFDLGIPVDAKQPMQMVRECRREPLAPKIPIKISEKATKLLSLYDHFSKNLNDKESYHDFLTNENDLVEFFSEHCDFFNQGKDVSTYKIREKIFNTLGLLSAGKDSDEIKALGRRLSQSKKEKVVISDLVNFVDSSRERLAKSLEKNIDIVFVMGHKNPDSDTAVSSVFEAYRNHLVDGDTTTYIPIIQYYKIPDDIKELLGERLSKGLLLTNNHLYKMACVSGLARWISVDQNREPEVQKYFISIIDHHIVSKVAQSQDLPKTLEKTGSCTALVAQKILGMGLSFDSATAKILYGATLMDTEDRVNHKMTLKDQVIMDRLKEISETADDDEYYSHLMSYLLNTDNPELLFKRDYKEDWGFGFAVLKIKGGFSENGSILKKDLLDQTVKLGESNNQEENLPLTLIKITDYMDDNMAVNRERLCLVFNPNTKEEFRKTISDVLKKIISFEFEGISIEEKDNHIDFWGTGMQLSRKKTVPLLEPLVKAFNEYFYSKSANLFVKRDFLRKTSDSTKAAEGVGLEISTDNADRLNYMTFEEAKKLCNSMGYTMLSIKEYWEVLNDAKEVSNIEMVESMQGSNFVEFWDTAIKNSSIIIHHPEIEEKDNVTVLSGDEEFLKIPRDNPGLLDPKDIDIKTGFPKKVQTPDQYDDPKLWRYWGPDDKLVVPTRSYIFLLDQPSFDCKFHLGESFPNLGIRPCIKKVPLPEVTIDKKGNVLRLIIKKEGDRIEYLYEK